MKDGWKFYDAAGREAEDLITLAELHIGGVLRASVVAGVAGWVWRVLDRRGTAPTMIGALLAAEREAIAVGHHLPGVTP